MNPYLPFRSIKGHFLSYINYQNFFNCLHPYSFRPSSNPCCSNSYNPIISPDQRTYWPPLHTPKLSLSTPLHFIHEMSNLYLLMGVLISHPISSYIAAHQSHYSHFYYTYFWGILFLNCPTLCSINH